MSYVVSVGAFERQESARNTTQPAVAEVVDSSHQKASASDSSKAMASEMLAVPGESCRLEVLIVLGSVRNPEKPNRRASEAEIL